MHGASMLRDGVVMLGVGMVFVLIFRRLGLGATLGFLIAGALIGPQALNLIGDAQGKITIAELGITLLLFIVGLELNPARLWKMKQDIFALGLIQVLLCGGAVGTLSALPRLDEHDPSRHHGVQSGSRKMPRRMH